MTLRVVFQLLKGDKLEVILSIVDLFRCIPKEDAVRGKQLRLQGSIDSPE